MAGNVRDLIQSDSQVRFMEVQVRRNGNWITVPIESAQAQLGKNKAGQVKLVIGNDDTDQTRSQLYEGDRIRMFRGVLGAAPVRCWTGYVDTRGPTDSQGISREISVTDHIKELNDAIMLDGVFYDNMTPTAAAADVIQRALNSQQLKIYDDADNLQSSTASYSSPTGNNVCYFPDLLNDDGSTFYLPQGTLASNTASTGQLASFTIPVASGGATYSTFELPKRFVIASTMSMPGFTIASTSQNFPPASGTAILDAYNGILYFASSQASTMVSFSATYYDQPNWDFPAGTKCGDVVSQIMDKVGCRWGVDANGKFWMTRIDAVHAPSRILNKGQYVSNGVEINRDRRNVIVCLGWDGNCGGILAAKAVNTDDINNGPPKGLGKRAYLVVQDRSWKTQYAVSKAAYYAVQQVGRRGKIVNVQILDDPTITTPETVICFESTLPEIGSGDFFYIEDIQWNYANKGNGFQAMMSLSGTMLPGQGLVYLGPITGTTSTGSLDFSKDVQCITNPSLALPSINKYPNSDSLSGTTLSGLTLASGGPGGATDAEYTGTGSASGSLRYSLKQVSVSMGQTYTLSWWIDPSQITNNNGVQFQFGFNTADNLQSILTQNLASTATTAGRYATAAWTCPTNLVPHSDDFSGWSKSSSNMVLGTGGPNGATDWEYTGTGAASGFEYAFNPAGLQIAVTPGQQYTLSCGVDASQITAGQCSVYISDALGNTYSGGYLGIGSGSGRFALSPAWTCPAGVTQVSIFLDTNNCTVASGQKLKWWQPMLEPASSASGYYISSQNPQVQIFAQLLSSAIVASGQKFKISQPQLEINTVATPYQSSNATTPNSGGSYYSTFSIVNGLDLTYTIGSLGVTESVDIYGSDGSHIVGDQNVARAANQTLTLQLPTSQMTVGVLYVIRLWVKDSSGNIGIYRTFATALP